MAPKIGLQKKGEVISQDIFHLSHPQKIRTKSLSVIFSTERKKLRGANFVLIFEDGTKLKITSEITPSLN